MPTEDSTALVEPSRIVAHVDMDAFFAACEEQRRPEAAGKPLIVGASPRNGAGRGVVVAANYAARALGVRSATPIRDAWRRAPEAHYVRPDHAHYASVSRTIFDRLRSEFSIEQVSIDEAYLDLGSRADWDGAIAQASRIRGLVADASQGLSCSVGIGPNKLVAKIASDHRKPAGTTIVVPGEVESFLGPLSARKIPGIGPRTDERLEALALRTIADLRTAGRLSLESTFGSHGAFMWEAAHGRDRSYLHVGWEPSKSVSEEHTFSEDTRDRTILLGTLRRMVSGLERDLARHGYWYKSVALKVRYTGFETHTRQVSLPRHSKDTTKARRLIPRLLDGALEDPRRLRLIGLRFGELAHGLGQRTLPDFSAAATEPIYANPA